jgi:hypothetical protein
MPTQARVVFEFGGVAPGPPSTRRGRIIGAAAAALPHSRNARREMFRFDPSDRFRRVMVASSAPARTFG